MKCIHCFRETIKYTKDHVFPAAWYTDNTPLRVQRWTVPSCGECNNKYGELEQSLFRRLVPCIDPRKAEASGIHQKLYRSFGMGDGISPEEKAIRAKSLMDLLIKARPYTPDLTSFPGLGPHEGFPNRVQLAIPAPVEYLVPVTEKIFRGVEYKLGKRYIEPPLELKVYFVNKEPKDIETLMRSVGYSTSLGPGFRVDRAYGKSGIAMYRAIIWGTLKAYASVDMSS